MNKYEIKRLIAYLLIAFGVFVHLTLAVVSTTDEITVKKRALAILGDAHHRVFL